MSSDNEYFSENDEIQPISIDLENSPHEIATIEDEGVEHNNHQNESNKNDSKKEVVKPKRIIKNPIPKFNEHTIRNEKGLPVLLNHFKDVKFKGRGYEEEDLNKLMKIYEYWCHRFYPMFTFDDSIQKLEALGNKKSTQIYLKKIRMGIEDVYQEIISEENIQTEGFVEPFEDHLLTPMHESEAELTKVQIEQIKQNKLRAEAIRKERLSRIYGVLSQEYDVTVCENYGNKEPDLEMQVNEEELSIDNILKMVNEDIDSSNYALDKNKEQLYDKKISNAVRKNVLSFSSDSENDENCINEVTRLQKQKSHESNEISDDNSNHSINYNNSTASSNERALLHSTQSRKFKRKSKINGNSLRKKRKISTDSDDNSESSHLLQQFSSQKKRKSASDITNNISDNDEEQQVQSNGGINIPAKENLRNITDEDVDLHKDNFLDSDKESNTYDNAENQQIHKFKQKRQLIIDSDESD